MCLVSLVIYVSVNVSCHHSHFCVGECVLLSLVVSVSVNVSCYR